MKILKPLLLLALCLPVKTALAAEVPAAFKTAFGEHLQKGTLFDRRTAQDFRDKGWGRFYQEAIVTEFGGTPVDKVRLVIAPLKDQILRRGTKPALMFRLFNDSDQDIKIWEAGSCKTVHAVSYMVIDAQGQLTQNGIQQILGGPHCFCQQYEATLWRHSARWLDTDTTAQGIISWKPEKTGRYVVIGTYFVPTPENQEREILSNPLIINVD